MWLHTSNIACSRGDLAVSDPFTSIVIQKVDGKTGKPLMGAKFGLYDQSDKLVDSLVSDRDGLVAFSKIAQGSYKIRELQPPEGYAANGKLITVNITETYVNPTEPYVVENAPQPQTAAGSVVMGVPGRIVRTATDTEMSQAVPRAQAYERLGREYANCPQVIDE